MTKETILILDKELNTQWTLKALLESEKYIVLTVNTIEKALRNFREFEVSGLVTEYWIGNSNTIGIIRELKKEFPELYVMMVTDEDIGEQDYSKIMNLGVDDFFLKPFSSEKVLIHLKKGLRQRKTYLQKKKIEQELNQIKTKVQDLPPVTKSFYFDKSMT
jgi:DNA-binding response OmpR family regulator